MTRGNVKMTSEHNCLSQWGTQTIGRGLSGCPVSRKTMVPQPCRANPVLPWWQWMRSGCGAVSWGCCPCRWSRRLQAGAASPGWPKSCWRRNHFLRTLCSASACPQKLWGTPLLHWIQFTWSRLPLNTHILKKLSAGEEMTDVMKSIKKEA